MAKLRIIAGYMRDMRVRMSIEEKVSFYADIISGVPSVRRMQKEVGQSNVAS